MKSSSLTFALTAVLVCTVPAQTPTQAPPVSGTNGSSALPAQGENSAPPIQVTTRLVLLNVLVHNRDGQPVGDLSKTDFEVTDAGRRQTISLFSVNHLALEPAVTSPAQTLPRNFAANRPLTQEGAPASVTVVLIDKYNTDWVDQAYSRQQALKFLTTVRSNDRIALYTLDSKGFSITHDFTNNVAKLTAAMTQTTPRPSRDLDAAKVEPADTGDSNFDQSIDQSNELMSQFFNRNRILSTCAALKSLADHLSGIPGRKNLVWITGSIPIQLTDDLDLMKSSPGSNGSAMAGRSLGRSSLNKQAVTVARDGDRQSYASSIDEVGQALNSANVAIYPVDARGLRGPSSFQASQHLKADPMNHNLPESPLPDPDFYQRNQNIATMEHLATLTGGKAFYNTNGIAEAIRRAIDDSSVTYSLGYYVSASDWDNRYHKLKVSVYRPGVSVRTKQGYYAKDKPTPTSAQIQDTLKNAVWSPLDSTRLSMIARVDPSSTLPNASRFSVVIAPSEIDLRQQNGRYVGELGLLIIQHRKGGGWATESEKTITLGLMPERYQFMLQNGMVLGEDLTIHPDTVAVRIIIVDHSSGSTGSVTMAIDPKDKSGTSVTPPGEETGA